MDSLVWEIAQTEAFDEIITRLEKDAHAAERQTIAAAESKDIETVRLAAGRAGGIRLAIDRLRQLKRKPDGLH